MLKKCVILGLALMVVGGLAFAWVRQQAQANRPSEEVLRAQESLMSEDHLAKYEQWHRLTVEEQNQLVLELDKDRQNKSDEQLAIEQKARILKDLDKLAAGQVSPGDITDLLYGPNWQTEVEEYRKRKEQEQIAQTTSVVCLAIGGAVAGGSFIIWVFWSIGRGLNAWKRHRMERRRLRQLEATELTDILDDDDALADEDEDEEEEDTPEPPTGRRASAEELVGVGPVDSDPVEQVEHEERFIVPRTHSDAPSGRRTLASESRDEEEAESQLDANPVAMLLSDEPGGEPEWSPDSEWSTRGGDNSTEDGSSRQRFTPRPKVMILGEDEHPFTEIGSETEDSAGETENALQNQADGLQKQIAEFRELAQGAEQTKSEVDSPVGDTLKELAQQVSAIREYAASQQNRVEKLQDGYDWTIIRTFCLRVIRCIDNLENRIERLVETDNGAGDLEEVKDELLFALESSGIEQFRPELNSDYRGQEKLAEAVKERQTTKKTDRIGKIAKVVRPGYRYIIDEETCKVVRTAQVKLFG